MLKSFFGSKTRVKLLGLFLLHPKNEYFIRELTRTLKEQINSIRRELNNLKKVGLLKSYTKNRKKYYFINEEFELLDEFKSIFAKLASPQEEIVKAISDLGEIDFLLMSGEFVGAEESAVDLLIVGDVDKPQLKKYIEEELSGAKKIKFAVMTRADFLYRLDCKDQFVLDVVSAKDKLTPINKLKKYIDARVRR